MEEAGQFDEHEQSLEGFNRIIHRFGDADAAWYWLTVPNNTLDGEKPLALLREATSLNGRPALCGRVQREFCG